MEIANHVHFVDGSSGRWPWKRQLPGGTRCWGTSQYYFDTENLDRADWLVVFSSWEGDFLPTSIPIERRIFVAGEPESFHRYQPKFLNQFGTVLTTQRKTKHNNALFSQVAINWFAGVEFIGNDNYKANLNFEDFLVESPVKSKLCSVITSGKTMTAGHKRRYEFVDLLKKKLSHQIDFFGRDSIPVSDKDLALSQYRYHIALENSVAPDYWTEKFADPILRGCFPLYSGCPNIADYFPEGSYLPIDIGAPEQAVSVIASVLASDIDIRSADSLASAKQHLLYQHNLFAVLERIYVQARTKYPHISYPAPVTLWSDHQIKNQKITRRLRRTIRNFWGKS